MENMNEHVSTNSNTSTIDIETPFQHFFLEEPHYVQNLSTYSMNSYQNDYNPSSLVHHPQGPQPHPMSYLPQAQYNPSMQSSYCYPPSYHFSPLSFPTHPYINAPGGGMITGASDAPLVHFPYEVPSYEQPWDVTQDMLTMAPMDMSEYERKMKAKAARLNRKMALQLSRSHKTASKSSSSSNSSASSSKSSRKLAKQSTSGNNKNVDEDLFTFCTQDNKKLRVLLVKVLTSSDVVAPRRIILPKREAEENLPELSKSCKGVYVVMKKVHSDQEWRMRYRFWANHDDRMYILDQIGNFVSDNNLECGDSLILLQDKELNFYFSIKKAKKKLVAMPLAAHDATKGEGSSEQSYNYNAYIATPFPAEAIAEEDSNLAILTEQLKPKENYDDNNLATLYDSFTSRYHINN